MTYIVIFWPIVCGIVLPPITWNMVGRWKRRKQPSRAQIEADIREHVHKR